MALRTGISIIAGSSAAFALSLVFSQWWARRGRKAPVEPPDQSPPIVAGPSDEAPPGTNIHPSEAGEAAFSPQSSDPSSSPSVPVHIGPIIDDPDTRLQALDGDVSARPTEQWRDDAEDAYDAADPEDLGSMYLARAVQVPEGDDVGSYLDVTGLHVDQLPDTRNEDSDDDEVFSWNFSDDAASNTDDPEGTLDTERQPKTPRS